MSDTIISRLFIGVLLDPAPVRTFARELTIDADFRGRIGEDLALAMEEAERTPGPGFRAVLNSYLNSLEEGLCFQTVYRLGAGHTGALLGIKLAEADVDYEYAEVAEPKLVEITHELYEITRSNCRARLRELGIKQTPSIWFDPEYV